MLGVGLNEWCHLWCFKQYCWNCRNLIVTGAMFFMGIISNERYKSLTSRRTGCWSSEMAAAASVRCTSLCVCGRCLASGGLVLHRVSAGSCVRQALAKWPEVSLLCSSIPRRKMRIYHLLKLLRMISLNVAYIRLYLKFIRGGSSNTKQSKTPLN